MKKLFLITIAAFCLVAVGCKKTCHCTDTVTQTWPDFFDDDWDDDWPFGDTPNVSTATYTKEAKKCSDLNANATINQGFMQIKTVTVCQ